MLGTCIAWGLIPGRQPHVVAENSTNRICRAPASCVHVMTTTYKLALAPAPSIQILLCLCMCVYTNHTQRAQYGPAQEPATKIRQRSMCQLRYIPESNKGFWAPLGLGSAPAAAIVQAESAPDKQRLQRSLLPVSV